MQELINVKAIGTAKLIIVRYLALLAAVLIPVFLLSLESLVPLVEFSVETGIEIDLFAFAKYILWWLLPTSMIVLALGMFLTILTRTPVAVIVQLVWWFMDSSFTELSGDTGLFTLMIRHNLLNGSELIRQDLGIIWMNRGIMAGVAVLLVLLSIVIYEMKRGGKLEQKIRCRSGWELLLRDFPLVFKSSLILTAVYLAAIPMIRGISNLDPARSADCFSSSLSILGIILIVPAMRWESGQANMGLKELLLTKSISLRVVLTFRVVVSVLILLCLVTGFAIVMRWCGCEFPFWIYILRQQDMRFFLD